MRSHPVSQVSSDAAAARSAALRRVELARPRSVIGKNTVECMQAGAVFGFAGLVDGLVSRIREDVDGFGGDDVAVVATGHTAPLLLPDLHTSALRPTPDPRRAAVGVRTQPRQPARQAQASPLKLRFRPCAVALSATQHAEIARRTCGSGRRRGRRRPAPGSSAICRTWCTDVRCRTAASYPPRRRSGRRAQPQVRVLIVELDDRAVRQAERHRHVLVEGDVAATHRQQCQILLRSRHHLSPHLQCGQQTQRRRPCVEPVVVGEIAAAADDGAHAPPGRRGRCQHIGDRVEVCAAARR